MSIHVCTQLYTHVYTTVYTRVHYLALSMSPVGYSSYGLRGKYQNALEVEVGAPLSTR